MFQKLKSWLANIVMIFGFLFITILIGMVILVHKIAEETGLDQAFLPVIKAAYLLKEHYVEPLNPQQTKERMIGGLVNNLDPHTMYLTPDDVKSFKEDMQGAYGGIGIGAKPSDDKKSLIIKDVQDKGPAALLGLKAGDKIFTIDGSPVEKNTMQENFKKIRGPIGSKVELEVLPEKSELRKKVKVERKAIELPTAQWALIDAPNDGGKIFVIRETQFNDELLPQTIKAIRAANKEAKGKIKGIILDLRDNPGGLITSAVGLSSLFGKPGALVVSARDRDPTTERKWRAMVDDWSPTEATPPDEVTNVRKEASWLIDAPMVVVVNRRSASASEIVAGAMKDWNRALIVGNNTFGKGSIQSIVPLGKEHGAVKITTSRYYTPAGKAIQAVGVAPDVEVKSSLDRGIREADLPKHLNGEAKTKKENDVEDLDKLSTKAADMKDPQLLSELAVESERSTFSPKLKLSDKDLYIQAAIKALRF